jgi:probable F420-dependent oxidoreductase
LSRIDSGDYGDGEIGTTVTEMERAHLVRETRVGLGRVGAFLPNISPSLVSWKTGSAIAMARATIDTQRRAVRRLEQAGYRAAWCNDGVSGKDTLVQLGILLAATDRLVLGSAITTIWSRPPHTAQGAAAMLAEAYPRRFVLGLGVGYPEQAEVVGMRYGRPIDAMRMYLARMADSDSDSGDPGRAYPKVVAANGPKMVALAAEVADGAMPNTVPVDHTARVRSALGPDKLLVVGLPVAVAEDPKRAKTMAQRHLSAVVSSLTSPYAMNLMRMGYTAEELRTVSDRVLDAVIGYGRPAKVAAMVRAHIEAGADHVKVYAATPDYPDAIDQLELLAREMAFDR